MSLGIDFKTNLHKIIIGLLLILIVLILYKRQENAGNTATTAGGLNNFSAEALANIAKVYADVRQLASFNNMTITGNAQITTSNLMPRGGIIIWSGNEVPASWALCDGTNGTPDLRGRFILGAGQGTGLTLRTKGQTGGAETHTLSIPEMPVHSHAIHAIQWGPGSGYSGGSNGISGQATSSDTGGGQPHNNMPPFYVLAYIIKL
jgi:microcystin-dependent protein